MTSRNLPLSSLTTPASRRAVLKTGAGAALASTVLPLGLRHALAQGEPVTIDFWNWWGVDREPLMKAIIDEFQAEFPNIVVNSLVQPWDRRDEQVVTALSGGDPPEVLMATRQEIVQFASLGTIVPITAHAESAGLDLDRYYPSEIASMWWNDELYSLPMPTAGGETGIAFYNKDLFSAAGLDPEVAPATWAELDDVAGALTKLDANGAIDILGVDIGTGGDTFLAWLYTNGGALYSEDMKTIAFNSEQGKQTLQWQYEFLTKHYGDQQNYADFFANTTGESGEDPLYQGRLGLTHRNVSQFFHLSNLAPDLNYGVGLRAYNADNPEAKSQGVAGLTFGWGYVIPVGLDPAVEAAAFEWVKRLTYDDQGACRFVLEQARPSPLQDCNENPAYEEANPHWATVLEALSKDVAVGIVPPQTRVLTTLNDYVDLALYGELETGEALDLAAEETQGFLDEYWSSVS